MSLSAREFVLLIPVPRNTAVPEIRGKVTRANLEIADLIIKG